MTTQLEISMVPVLAKMFCWNEIATRDPESVKSFYCSLFGWTTSATDCGAAGYTLFKLADEPICGMIEMDENWPDDVPTHWGAYIACDDVDETASRVESCGGTICCNPTDCGEKARMAVMTDPCGATVSIYQGGDGKNAFGYGAFCWNELFTTDTNKAGSFYTDLFGWEQDEGPEDGYVLFKNGDAFVGGMMTMHWEGTPSWLGYVNVEDVDAFASRATDLGAHLCVEPSDIPNIGRFAVITDPIGGTIGIFKCANECDAGECINEE